MLRAMIMTDCGLIRNIPVEWRKREFIRLPGIEIRDLFVGATALQEGYAVATENKMLESP
jgi:predicted nucleic acid-binding protein